MGIVYRHSVDAKPSLPELVKLAHSAMDCRCWWMLRVNFLRGKPHRNTAATGADHGLTFIRVGRGDPGTRMSTGLLCGTRELISSSALQMLDMDDHPELWDPLSQG